MYVSIRRYEAEATDELTRKVKKGFVPLISKAPGFIAFYAIDSGIGELASVSVFETKAAAEESNKTAAEWVKKNMPSIGQAEKTVGQVIAHKTTQAQMA